MTEQTWRKVFSTKLEELLLERGLTANMFSSLCGLGQPAIQRYLACERTPMATSVLKMAYALEVDVSELIDFGEPIEDDTEPGDYFYKELLEVSNGRIRKRC